MLSAIVGSLTNTKGSVVLISCRRLHTRVKNGPDTNVHWCVVDRTILTFVLTFVVFET